MRYNVYLLLSFLLIGFSSPHSYGDELKNPVKPDKPWQLSKPITSKSYVTLVEPTTNGGGIFLRCLIDEKAITLKYGPDYNLIGITPINEIIAHGENNQTYNYKVNESFDFGKFVDLVSSKDVSKLTFIYEGGETTTTLIGMGDIENYGGNCRGLKLINEEAMINSYAKEQKHD